MKLSESVTGLQPATTAENPKGSSAEPVCEQIRANDSSENLLDAYMGIGIGFSDGDLLYVDTTSGK